MLDGLNTRRILGSEKKSMAIKLRELSENWSVDKAEDYYNGYHDKSPRFIFDNSAFIFSEPYKGLPFYRSWIQFIPLNRLNEESSKFSDYCNDSVDKMHPETREEYLMCNDQLEEHANRCKSLIQLSNILIKDDEDCYDLECLCQWLRGLMSGKIINVSWVNNQIHNLILKVNPLLVLIQFIASDYTNDQFVRTVVSAIKGKQIDSIEDTMHMMKECAYFELISNDEIYTEFVDSLHNIESSIFLNNIGKEDVSQMLMEAADSLISDDDILPDVTVDTFVESVLEDDAAEKFDSKNIEETRNTILYAERAIYEAAFDIMYEKYMDEDPSSQLEEFPVITEVKESFGIDGPITVETGFNMIVEALSSIDANLTLEYTIDGSPSKVIRKDNKFSSDDERKNDSDDHDEDDEDDDKLPESTRNHKKMNSTDLPDSSNPNSKKPKKPKRSLSEKIQDKAINAHIKSKRAGGKIRHIGRKIANAGNAILKIPKDLVEKVKSFTKMLDEMDDNRRKEYMLKPGNRKKLLKNLRVAATYAISISISPIMGLITWFSRKLSKEKNKRIRNEYASELDTEIDVYNAKIEDASSDGKKQERYRLMRIRDKLKRDRDRVALNGKYM